MAVDDFGRTIPDTPAITPEIEASILALRNTGNAAASVPYTMLAPDPKLPGPFKYVPGIGAGEAVLGFGGAAWQALADLANLDKNSPAAKWGLQVPDAPKFLSGPGDRFQENRKENQSTIDTYTGSVLPKPDMETVEGNVADTLGSGIGTGIGIAPSSLLRFAPYGLKTASSFMLPTFSHTARNVPVTTGLATAGLVLEQATDPRLREPNPPLPDATQTQQPVSLPTTAAAVTTPPATKAYTSLSDVPGFDAAIAPFAPADTAPAKVAPAEDKSWQDQAADILEGKAVSGDVGPTFGQQGYTDIDMFRALGTVALTFGGVSLGRRIYIRHGAELSARGRDERYNNPAYAQAAQDYNNSVVARGNGEISPPAGEKAPVAPLPTSNVVGRASTAASEYTVNEAARVQQWLKYTAENPSVGQRMASQYGNIFDTDLMNRKLQYFIETGHDKESGVHITPPRDAMKAYAKLDEVQLKKYTDALFAESELQKRRLNDDKVYDFPGATSEDLGRHIANGRSDPQVAEAIRLFKEVKNGMADIGEHDAHQFFTRESAEVERTLYRDHMPEADKDGRLIHPGLGLPPTRSPYTGTSQVSHDPIVNLTQHVEQLFKQFHFNDVNRMIRDHQLSEQQRNPKIAQFMTDVQAPTGPHTSLYGPDGIKNTFGTARDPIVIVRDKNGVQHLRVDEPNVYRGMTANGLLSARVRLGALNVFRKMFSKGTTGGLSSLTGRLYPPVGAFYTTLQMGAYSPVKAYGGPLDRLQQRTLPESISRRLSPVARMLDTAGPNQVGTAFGYLGDRGQHWFVNRMSEIFHPQANNVVKNFFESVGGPEMVESIHKGMRNRYEKSNEHFTRSEGVSGLGNPMRMETPGVRERTGEPGMGLRLVSAGVVPKAYFKGDWMGTGAKPFVMNIESLLGEAAANVADAGHKFFVRLNRDNPNFSKDELVYEARNLVGNPGRRGSSKILNAAESTIPYTNIAVQGSARLGRALTESPTGAALAVAGGMSLIALGSLLSHMRSQAHMDFMQDELSLQQRESKIVFATSSDPTAPTMLTINQEYRGVYAFALDFWSKVINYVGARHDPATFENVWEGIKGFLGSHITNSNLDAMIHGGVDVADVFNLPPIAGHIDWNSVIHGKGLFDAYSNINNYHNPPPGQGVDSPLDSKTGHIFQEILSNGIGALASAITPIDNAVRYHNEGKGFWESIGMGGHDWLYGAKGSNSQLNVIMETPMRLSTNPPIVEAMRPALAWFKTLPKIDDPSQLGFTTRGRAQQPVPVTTDRPLSMDHAVRSMLQVAHGYATRVDQALEPVKAIQMQMASVDKMGMDPETKRVWMNERKRDIADKYKFVESIVGDAQYALSKLAGKHVTLGWRSNIDWSKDMSQFAN